MFANFFFFLILVELMCPRIHCCCYCYCFEIFTNFFFFLILVELMCVLEYIVVVAILFTHTHIYTFYILSPFQ